MPLAGTKIGIIGAGAGGLCALRHVLESPSLVPTVWEKTEQVGGTWVYTERVGADANGLPVHSTMYKNLRTNLPKEVMGFPGFPFKDSRESFIHHSAVLEYLRDYADHYSLMPHIKLGHHVEHVDPKASSWEVTVRCLSDNSTTTETYDALFVCAGHYSVPKIPDIPGIENYQGMQMHSHDYRDFTPFKDMTVIILGARSSGLDISLEAGTVAKTIFLSHDQPAPIISKLPENFRQVAGISSATETGFFFHDGSFAEADAIIFCTGYHYSFPFLSPACDISVKENQVQPLYKHLINSTYPTMAIVGIPFLICPFLLFDFQVCFFLKVLLGKVTLPSKQEMDLNTKEELDKRRLDGFPTRHFHKMGKRQWRYFDEFATVADLEPYPAVYRRLFDHVSERKDTQLMWYKSDRFAIKSSDTFITLED